MKLHGLLLSLMLLLFCLTGCTAGVTTEQDNGGNFSGPIHSGEHMIHLLRYRTVDGGFYSVTSQFAEYQSEKGFSKEIEWNDTHLKKEIDKMLGEFCSWYTIDERFSKDGGKYWVSKTENGVDTQNFLVDLQNKKIIFSASSDQTGYFKILPSLEQYLLITNNEANLVSLFDKGARRVSVLDNCDEWLFSVDEKKVAYIENGSIIIYNIDTDTAEKIFIISQETNERIYINDWNNSDQILYSKNGNELWLLNTANDEKRLIGINLFHAKFFLNNNTISYTVSHDISMIPVDYSDELKQYFEQKEGLYILNLDTMQAEQYSGERNELFMNDVVVDFNN